MISDKMIAVGQTALIVGCQYVKAGEKVVSNVPIESSVDRQNQNATLLSCFETTEKRKKPKV